MTTLEDSSRVPIGKISDRISLQRLPVEVLFLDHKLRLKYAKRGQVIKALHADRAALQKLYEAIDLVQKRDGEGDIDGKC